MSNRVSSRVRTPKPADLRVTQPESRPAKGDSATCACGCGESFIRDRATQRFILDHRHRAYQTHECPECHTTHRIAVRNMK